jgi:sulfate adenylyltransferase (ADP) / ATP adenylyltransferase
MRFISSLPTNASPLLLYQIYHDLLESTQKSWTKYSIKHNLDAKDFSYNMAMTTSAMIMAPRISEGLSLHGMDGSDLGFVGMNGSFLCGGVLVKKREEWELLRQSHSSLDTILSRIGVPATDAESNM